MSLIAQTPLIAAGDGDEFHPPSLGEFIGLPSIFTADGPLGFLSFLEGTPFDMNRIILVRILALIVLVVVFYLALRKVSIVPSRMQSLAELGVGFIKTQIADELLGEKIGRRFLPFLVAMFFGILFMNLTGLIPGLNIAGTSLVGMPLTLGMFAYFAFIYAGIKEVGAGKFVMNSLFPPGAPWYMYILLTPIEFINIFIVRPLSLALRLLLNMVVGHMLLVLCFAATHFFVLSSYSEGAMRFLGIPSIIFGIIFTLVELLVAVLQAFVFTLLTASYIQMAVAEEH